MEKVVAAGANAERELCPLSDQTCDKCDKYKLGVCTAGYTKDGVKCVYDFTLPSDFERMYEDYFKVYNFIFYRLLHKQDTEDLVSEVFLKVARNIFSFNAQKASFNTWIFTIARNTLTDYFAGAKTLYPWMNASLPSRGQIMRNSMT